MSNKKAVKKISEDTYKCRWCGKEKVAEKFFKCSIQHNSFICSDCIKQKYNELNRKCEKYLAIFICCHYLDIAFYWDIYQTLKIGEGIGYYIRQLNLIQNQNPDTFEDGIIKNSIIDYTPRDFKVNLIKEQMSDIITELEKIKNDMQKFEKGR